LTHKQRLTEFRLASSPHPIGEHTVCRTSSSFQTQWLSAQSVTETTRKHGRVLSRFAQCRKALPP
jgi:hypothetical protein